MIHIMNRSGLSTVKITMGKLWTRIKFRYLKNLQKVPNIVKLAGIIGLLYLCYTLFLRRSLNTSGYPYRTGHKPIRTHMTSFEIDTYLRALRDTKPTSCISNIHNIPPNFGSKTPIVSIILHFRNEEFYLLKLTLTSLVKYTRDDLLREVIIIDDGSKQAFQNEAQLFFTQEQFESVGLRTYRSEKAEGGAQSRLKAAALATGKMLIFIRSDVVLNKGWIEPVLSYLDKHSTAIVVPHMDSVLDGYRWLEGDTTLVTVVTLTLSIIHYKNTSTDDIMPLPVTTGRMFGVNKEFFDSIGGYDQGFIDGEGADLELSLRTWLCGGQIVKLSCSRVSAWDLLTPQDINNPENIERLAEMWLDDYKHTVYKQTGVSTEVHQDVKHKARAAKVHIQQVLRNTCKDMKWYLTHVGKQITVPAAGWNTFGKLRSFTGKCLTPVAANNGVVEMTLCMPPFYDPYTLFEHTADSYLQVLNRCLVADSPKTVRLIECSDGSDSLKMQWEFQSGSVIKNKAFGLCLEHSTSVQGVILTPCVDSDRQKWFVMKY